MCDVSRDLLLNWEGDEPIPAPKLIRPETPTPHGNRTLQRTKSYASINSVDTVRSQKKIKGIRRRIDEIAESLKNKDAKKKNVDASSQEVSKSDSRSKNSRRPFKRTKSVRNAPRRSERNPDLALPDKLYSGLSSELDTSSISPEFIKPDSPVDVEEEGSWDGFFPHFTIERFRPISKADVKDIQLEIQSLESDVTIWDGLQAPCHLYKCRLYLHCTTQPYESVSIPDIRLLEMDCNTSPVPGIPYARAPILLTSYQGAAPDLGFRATDGAPTVKLADGIHVDKLWRTILGHDGAWGWYRDAYVPLSPRLFDKMDHREFKLAARVWMENHCVEGESTFGVSMLLRGVDMPK